MLTITNEDCMELMARYPDGYFDLAIVDPPYFEVRGGFDFAFDGMQDYLTHVEAWGKEIARVCKPNANIIWWGMDKKIAYTQTILDRHLHLLSTCVWERPGISSEFDTRRTVPERGKERFLVYTGKSVMSGRGFAATIKDDKSNYANIKAILRDCLKQSGLTIKQVCELTTTYASHYFTNSQWAMITEVDFNKLAAVNFWGNLTYSQLRVMYEKQRAMYEEQMPYFNNAIKATDVFKATQDHFCEWHPTVKPFGLTKKLLTIYGRPRGRVLIPFLGSGTEAIACHDYGYDLTACELDPDYYNAAMKRIAQHTSQLKLI